MPSGEKQKRRLREVRVRCPRCAYEQRISFDVTLDTSKSPAIYQCHWCQGHFKVELAFDVSPWSRGVKKTDGPLPPLVAHPHMRIAATD